LVAIADAVGGQWPQRARAAAVALVATSKEVEPSLGVRLLTDLRVAFAGAEALPSETILEKLVAINEAPWGDLKGRPLDQRGLARRLRQYGIKSRQIRFGERGFKGYLRADLHDAWNRYIPSSEKSETSETSTEKINSVSHVSDVSHVAANGGEGPMCAHCGGGDVPGNPIQ
jgi:hypothetical protein